MLAPVGHELGAATAGGALAPVTAPLLAAMLLVVVGAGTIRSIRSLTAGPAPSSATAWSQL